MYTKKCCWKTLRISGKIFEIMSKLRTATGMNSMKNVIRVKNIIKTIANASRDFEVLYFVDIFSTNVLNIYAVIAANPNGSRTIDPIFFKKNQDAIETRREDIQNLAVNPKKRLLPFIIQKNNYAFVSILSTNSMIAIGLASLKRGPFW